MRAALIRHRRPLRAWHAPYHAAVCTKLGAPLEYQEMSSKPLKPGEVRLRVAAAGVNFADILQARGEYQDRADPPFVPGNEAAGEICEVGPQVDSLKVGDQVVCIQRGGSYSEESVAKATVCFRLPEQTRSMDLAEAAALLCNYGTAHLALTKRAQLQPGETVVVTAAAGGVGLAAVEIAKLCGASRVIAACGSDEKLAVAASQGAEVIGVNYNGLDGRAFRAQLKEVLGKSGMDVCVDMVGGDLLEPIVRSLNWNGRAVVVGFAGGSIPKIPANILLVKNVSVHGLFWGAHLMHDPATLMASARQLVEWWAAGDIKPHVSGRVPLERANEAFELVTSRKSTGKVVIVP